MQKDLIFDKRMIFHFSVIIFLELTLKSFILEILTNSQKSLFEDIKEFLKLSKQSMDIVLNIALFDELVSFVKEVCFLFEFDF